MAIIMKWTKKDIEILKNGYFNKKINQLSKTLNRTPNSIRIKASELKLKKYNRWTEKELSLLKKIYIDGDTNTIIKSFPKHTLGSINKKAEEFKLRRKNLKKPRWTEKEIGELKKLFNNNYSSEKVSIILGKSIGEVNRQRRKHKILFGKIKWSEEEINILRKYYKTMTNKQIQENFLSDRTMSSIGGKIRNLGLKKPKSLLWSKKEVDILKNKYSSNTIEELSDIFPNKLKTQINKKAKRLKLTKDKETLLRCFGVNKMPTTLGKRGSWRRKVLKRDSNICQNCNKKFKRIELHAHHIIPLRFDASREFDINNGICLCIKCHKKITRSEHKYENKFQSIIGRLV